MTIFKRTASIALALLLMAGSAIAQGQQMQQTQPDSITNQELKKFAEISTEAQKIQVQQREKVDSMLAEKEMGIQRFQQILMSKRNPKMADSLDITKKEEKTIKELQPKLMKMNQKAQRKFVSVIQDKGLKPQRFQAIMQAVRTDPQVMKRFQKIMLDSTQK